MIPSIQRISDLEIERDAWRRKAEANKGAEDEIHYWRSEAWALEYCLRKVVEAADEFEKDCGIKHNDKLSEAIEWSRDILNAAESADCGRVGGSATQPPTAPSPAAPFDVLDFYRNFPAGGDHWLARCLEAMCVEYAKHPRKMEVA